VLWRLLWIIATTAGLIVGGFILHFPGSYGGIVEWDPAAVIFGGILGFLTGVFVGVGQWAALLLPRRTGVKLLLVMGIGIGVTHALMDGAPSSVPLVLLAAMSGAAITAALAFYVDERRPAVLGASFLGWAGGLLIAPQVTLALGLPWSETPVGWSTEHAFAGAIVGLAWAVSTAASGLLDVLKPARGIEPPLSALATEQSDA